MGDRVFPSSYSGYGLDKKYPGDVSKLQRHALCLDRKTGEILWNEVIPQPAAEEPYQGEYVTTRGYASGSPVSDGKGA